MCDRRFVGNRDILWTPLLEQSLRPHLDEVASGKRRYPPLKEPGESGRDGSKKGLYVDEWHDDFETWHEGIHLDRCVRLDFTQEVSAYRRLIDLQGSSVPRLYGTVRFGIAPPQKHNWPSDWNLDLDHANGLALEYIDGKSVVDLRRGVDVTDEEADAIGQAGLEIARKLIVRGVIHDDIASRNIVVRLQDCRPFLIDFGSAKVQRQGQTILEWKEEIENMGVNEVTYMRRALSKYGLHIPSPRSTLGSNVDPLTGWAAENAYIDRLTAAKEAKGYVAIQRKGPDHEIKVDAEGNPHKYEYARWKLRPGVRLAREDDKYSTYGEWWKDDRSSMTG